MSNLKLLIVEAFERSKKLNRLEEQYKKEKSELQMIKNYIVKEIQELPVDRYGDITIKMNIEGKEQLVKLDKNGNGTILHEVISL